MTTIVSHYINDSYWNLSVEIKRFFPTLTAEKGKYKMRNLSHKMF